MNTFTKISKMIMHPLTEKASLYLPHVELQIILKSLSDFAQEKKWRKTDQKEVLDPTTGKQSSTQLRYETDLVTRRCQVTLNIANADNGLNINIESNSMKYGPLFGDRGLNARNVNAVKNYLELLFT